MGDIPEFAQDILFGKGDRTMTENAVAVVNYEDYAMTPDRLVKQVELIQAVMKSVMRVDEHYGKIPGCGDKPSLLKPGAEKLSTTFRLAPSYEVFEKVLPEGHREYRVTATMTHIPTGAVFGQGVGSASTMESKYRYRKAERVCPKCGKETIINGKKEYGGGFICFAKKGGCGAKFKADDPTITNQISGRTEYEDPADYYNTILKMAKKRAHVDAVLTCTAASDIFTQDVEDLPAHLLRKNEPPIDIEPEPKREEKKKPSEAVPEYPEFQTQEEKQTFLNPTSILHKMIEAKIAESGVNRDLLKQYLFSIGKIELKDDKPSFNTMTQENAGKMVDNWDKTIKLFKAWRKKQAGEGE